MVLTADELKKQKTPELEKIMVLIEEILESRSDKSAEIAVGDKVSFEIRKNCVIEGEVLAKTDKRVKVHTTKISGVYQIASKKVDILASAPPADRAQAPAVVRGFPSSAAAAGASAAERIATAHDTVGPAPGELRAAL